MVDIGAGIGALVGPLLDAGATVVAVELHAGRAETLRRRFAGRDIRVVRCDVRELRLPRRPFRVVASPPYSAATSTVRLLLGSSRLIQADLVLQRAVVLRFVDRPPSARHALHYRLDVGRAIPRRAFRPPPRVDSQILRITRL